MGEMKGLGEEGQELEGEGTADPVKGEQYSARVGHCRARWKCWRPTGKCCRATVELCKAESK